MSELLKDLEIKRENLLKAWQFDSENRDLKPFVLLEFLAECGKESSKAMQSALEALLWATNKEAAFIFSREGNGNGYLPKIKAGELSKNKTLIDRISESVNRGDLFAGLKKTKASYRVTDLEYKKTRYSLLLAPVGEEGEEIMAVAGKHFAAPDIHSCKMFKLLFSLCREKAQAQGLSGLKIYQFHLLTILRLSKILSRVIEMEDILQLLRDSLKEVIPPKNIMLFLYSEEKTTLEAASVKKEAETAAGIKTGANFSTWVEHQGGEISLISDFDSPDFNQTFPGLSEQLKEKNMQLLIPLIHKWKLLGMLALGEKLDKTAFSPDELELLSILGYLCANAISNIHFYDLSITDYLTKLYLLRYFHQRFREELKRSVRYNKPLSIILWDVDDFKKINDNFGHLVGTC